MLCGACDGDDELARQLGNLRSGSRALHGETVEMSLRRSGAARCQRAALRAQNRRPPDIISRLAEAETSLAKFDESVGLLTSRLSEDPAG